MGSRHKAEWWEVQAIKCLQRPKGGTPRWRVYYRGNRRKQASYPYRVVEAIDEIGALKEFYIWARSKTK